MLTLEASLDEIAGVGPKTKSLFAKKGIFTLEDALYFVPRTYEDRSKLTPWEQLYPGHEATLMGVIQSARSIQQRRGSRFEASMNVQGKILKLVWFRSYPNLEKQIQVGQKLLVFGKVDFFAGQPQIVHPDFEKVVIGEDGKPAASTNFGRIVPVYSETEGLYQKTIRKIMKTLLRESLPLLDDALPSEMRQRLGLPTLRESFVRVHFPQDDSKIDTAKALARLAFEEFFIMQLGLALRKQERESVRSFSIPTSPDVLKHFLSLLPFALTGDQEKTLQDIQADLNRNWAMTRLVQGDVGSGKTVVALASGAWALAAGYQVAFLAPTEVLAQQHWLQVQKWIEPMGHSATLLTHSTKNKKEILEGIAHGDIRFVVGTHAIFQKQVEFKNLGLAIIDEQHRFGVEQREELLRKNTHGVPHLLLMTATPIPRTLALTFYGDLDVSIIKQKPAGRKPILTQIYSEKERPQAYQRMRKALHAGEQVYVIYPLVEQSEKLELKSATEMFESLSREVFPEVRCGLLHGRMSSEEKEEALKAFKANQTQLLVSTTVIEVGIDVANATLMVIEHPERLGLSQLHQLRGRVGRGEKDSECLLLAPYEHARRLKILERTEDGFEIAEEDLKLRGPGEFLGTKQSGLAGFRLAHLIQDADWLHQAKIEVEAILREDPELTSQKHRGIRQMIENKWLRKLQRLRGA